MTALRLYASNATTWASCPGSVRLVASAPRPPSTQAAEEGTAAHEVAAAWLRGVFASLGDLSSNGVPVTEEMIEGAALYFADVLAHVPDDQRVIEQALDGSSISPGMPVRIDCAGFNADASVLSVYEYKFGHTFVDAFENYQLVCYAVALWDWYEAAGRVTRADEDRTILRLVVVQPRSYHRDGPIREWRTTMTGLRAIVNVLREAAANALSERPRFKPGPQCATCDGRATCESLQRAAYVAADEAGNPTPFDLTPSQLGHELRWLHAAQRILKARVTALEQEATDRLKSGQAVAHYTIEHDPGRLEWEAGTEETAVTLASAFGVTLTKRPQLITPTQAIDAGIPAEVVKSLAVRRGTSKLTPFDTNKTRRIFGGTK